jgi:hypothetical protein
MIVMRGNTCIRQNSPQREGALRSFHVTDIQSVRRPFRIAIDIDLRQPINHTPDGFARASHA